MQHLCVCVLHRPKAIINVGIDFYIYVYISCLEGNILLTLFPVYLPCTMLLACLYIYISIYILYSYDFVSTPFSIVCLVTLHCLAMSSSSNPPLSCWTVDWTPPLSSTSCPFLSCTGESSVFLCIYLLIYGW